MRLVFYLFFVFFSFSAFSLFPIMRTNESFLEHEKKQKQFKSKQKNILKARLQQLETIRNQRESLQMQKAFLEYEEKQKQYENDRKRAFLAYKKQYEKYKKQQQFILESRLNKLKNFRKRIKKENPRNIMPY